MLSEEDDEEGGTALAVMPKRQLDFGTLPTGGNQTLVLADRVDLTQWTEMTLVVRVHSHTITGSNAISIWVYPQSWTPEDPDIQWLSAQPAGVSIVSTTPSPALLKAPLTIDGDIDTAGVVGALVRVTAAGTRASGGPMQALVSVQISGKEG